MRIDAEEIEITAEQYLDHILLLMRLDGTLK